MSLAPPIPHALASEEAGGVAPRQFSRKVGTEPSHPIGQRFLAVACVLASLIAPQRTNAQQGFAGQRGGQGSTGQMSTLGQTGQTGQLGQGQIGQLGAGGQSAGQGLGLASQADQLGQRNQQRSGFVGRNAEDIRNSFQNLSDSDRRRATFDLLIDNLNEMRDDRRRRERRRSQPPAARVQVTADFEVNAPSPMQSAEIATSRASDMMRRRNIPGASMAYENGAIVIRGTVQSEYEKALAAQLVSLEPGVREVDNQLQVAP